MPGLAPHGFALRAFARMPCQRTSRTGELGSQAYHYRHVAQAQDGHPLCAFRGHPPPLLCIPVPGLAGGVKRDHFLGRRLQAVGCFVSHWVHWGGQLRAQCPARHRLDSAPQALRHRSDGVPVTPALSVQLRARHEAQRAPQPNLWATAPWNSALMHRPPSRVSVAPQAHPSEGVSMNPLHARCV